MRIRVSWTISPKAFDIINKASKHNGSSVSAIADHLIMQKLADPIQVLKDKKREKIIELNKIDNQIKDLQEIKDPKKK